MQINPNSYLHTKSIIDRAIQTIDNRSRVLNRSKPLDLFPIDKTHRRKKNPNLRSGPLRAVGSPDLADQRSRSSKKSNKQGRSRDELCFEQIFRSNGQKKARKADWMTDLYRAVNGSVRSLVLPYLLLLLMI